jgi:hypothetical protein
LPLAVFRAEARPVIVRSLAKTGGGPSLFGVQPPMPSRTAAAIAKIRQLVFFMNISYLDGLAKAVRMNDHRTGLDLEFIPTTDFWILTTDYWLPDSGKTTRFCRWLFFR